MPPLEVPELPGGNPQLQRALQKIVKVEQHSVDRVDEKIKVVDNKMKLIKDLKDKVTKVRDSVSPFKSVNDFRDLKGESSSPDVIGIGAIDKNKARPGSYEFEVKSLANTASLMTTGAPDKDKTQLGVGYITFKTPAGGSKDVYINGDNNTMEGIAATINSAGVGVKAQVVNDGTDGDNPFRLILNGEKSGYKNDVKWAEFNFLDGDLDIDKYRSRDAKSAVVYFNGQPMYADENSMKEILPGAVIDLKKALPGTSVKVEIKPDFEKIEGKAKAFVDSVNGVLTFINSQNTVDADSRKDPTKALSGDSSLLSLQNRLQSMIQNASTQMGDNTTRRLSDVGITFNKAGTLEYDSKKFQGGSRKQFRNGCRAVFGIGPAQWLRQPTQFGHRWHDPHQRRISHDQRTQFQKRNWAVGKRQRAQDNRGRGEDRSCEGPVCKGRSRT